MSTTESFAFYYPRLDIGGVQHSLVLIANELHRRGYPVSFILWEKGGREFERLNTDINVIIPDHASTLRAIPSLTRYLLIEQPDYLLTRLEDPNVSATLACFMPGVSTDPVPGEGSVSSPIGAEARLPDRITRKVADIIYPNLDYFLVDSTGMKRHVVDLFDIQQDAVDVCPPAVLERGFQLKTPPSPHPFFEMDDPVVTSVGRLAPVKRYELLIRAVAQLQDDLSPRLVIAGDGEEKSFLADVATELDIDGRVALPGSTDQPLQYMYHADIFALTSRSEAFGIALVEALACGTPVVATDVPYGPREILSGGTYGKLTGETPVAVANGIREAYANNWDQTMLRNRASDFDVVSVTDTLLETLRNGSSTIRNQF
ncbi:glycosyltransferase [Halosimplex pelagicum]|uniref:Glycosyltransferase n=1 Tax=Halosimplex pelagicum TaxID=869886 RepID=A0A7D5TBE0_9EURY|nr:glycosyltransferase [Halosimplex pelagicum]QLH81215.1 glycosyltransferase [Halosimplex pelagicum]